MLAEIRRLIGRIGNHGARANARAALVALDRTPPLPETICTEHAPAAEQAKLEDSA